MRNRRKFLVLIIAIAAMVWLANAARQRLSSLAPTPKSGVIFTDHYRLSGEYADTLAVVAEQAILEAGSRVAGDAVLVGNQSAQAEGAVDGSLTLVGDSLALGTGGQVNGDLSAMGEQMTIGGRVEGRLTVVGERLVILPDAHISGDIVACVEAITDERPDARPIQPCQDRAALLAIFAPLQGFSGGFDLWRWAESGVLSGGSLLVSIAGSLLMTGLSALAVMAFPRRFSHLQEAVLSAPRHQAATGCMALLLTLGLSSGGVALATMIPRLGLVFVPLGLLLALGLVAMAVAGWIALALLLGDLALRYLTRAIYPPAVDAAFGSLLLFALWNGLALLPFGGVVGLLLMAALGCAGLGAVVTTRLGARPPYRRHFVQG